MRLLASSYKSVIVVGSIVYACSLVLLTLKKNEAEMHTALRAVDPSLSPVPVVDLASECGISNIKVALFDVHVFTHFFGWFVTTLALRDVTFSWVCGFIWEILEGSLEYHVPELRECWWDKVFMDLLGCNNLGIFTAWLVMRYFKIEEFNWAEVSTPDGSTLREMGPLYFVPGKKTLQQNYYGVFKSGKTLMRFAYVNIVILLWQFNLFFLKTSLWIPTLHWISICRSFITASLIILAAVPAYKREELTGYPMLLNMVLALEGLLVIRSGGALLFIGKGHLAIALMLLCVMALVAASFVGIVQQCKSYVSNVFSNSCKSIKVQ
jgi:hypothetical protein